MLAMGFAVCVQEQNSALCCSAGSQGQILDDLLWLFDQAMWIIQQPSEIIDSSIICDIRNQADNIGGVHDCNIARPS